jgi:site-specific recombinase XerD
VTQISDLAEKDGEGQEMANTPAGTALPTVQFAATSTLRLIELWRQTMAEQVAGRQLAADSMATYERGLRRWVDYLQTIACTDVPTPAVVQGFLTVLAMKAPATVATYLHAVRSLYRFAESRDIAPDITRSIRAPRQDRDQALPTLTPDQVRGLLDHVQRDQTNLRPDQARLSPVQAARDELIVRLLYGAALRTVSIVRDSTVGALDLDQGILRHRAKGALGREGSALPATAVDAARRYLALRYAIVGPYTAADPLLIAMVPLGHALTGASIRRIVGRLMEAAGIKRRNESDDLVDPGIYGPHALRRAGLTAVYRAHGAATAQAVAGHASIATTEKFYVRVEKAESLRRGAGALDL